MDFAIVGLGHAFLKQYEALKKIEKIKTIELCDSDLEKINKYNCKDNYIEISSNNVIVATSPRNHLEIIKNLIYNNKKVICEKPVVTNLYELNKLKKIITLNNYYNSLHFSYGLEIEYFINNIKIKPNKIYCYISDNYVFNNHINHEQIGLCGSYLDEVINPLSAISRMFGYNIKFISCEKKIYNGDVYDYYSLSKFNIENIPVEIEVLWDNNISQKYIDLYYDKNIIRLDSMNQQVIDITNQKVLFSEAGDRMTNHYIGVFNDYLEKGSNIEISIKLHEELLKGVQNENKININWRSSWNGKDYNCL